MARLAIALCALAAILPPIPDAAEASPTGQSGPTSLTYRHVDTFGDVDWRLTPGRFRRVRDVGSAADGTVYVLDDGHDALHVLDDEGRPLRAVRLPPPGPGFGAGNGHRSRGLDVATDGSVLVLRTAPADPYAPTTASWVDVLAPDGTRRAGFALSRPYTDVAADPQGHVVLSRSEPYVAPTPVPREAPERLPGGVDVFDRSGHRTATIEHPAVFYAMAVDVAADGTVYVANRVPSPWDYDRPGPDPTPLPAHGPPGAMDQADRGLLPLHVQPAPGAMNQAGPDPSPLVEGVAIFDPDRAYRETVPFTTPEDVAVGRAGVFVTRNVEIFALRAAAPLYAGPPGQVVVGFYDSIILHLDVPADGGLHAAMNHCYFQGLVRLDAPWATRVRARYLGDLDAPRLQGPSAPLRLAAGADLALLQQRFASIGEPPNDRSLAVERGSEPQSVQRWTASGRLRSQLGVCAGSMSSWLPDETYAFTARDVAADGDAWYTIEPGLLRRRGEEPFPMWSFWPGALLAPEEVPSLRAVAAANDHVAVLDAGAARVHVLGADGGVRSSWSLPTAGLPSDIALTDASVWLADRGAARIHRTTWTGEGHSSWPVHIAPHRIDAGPDGSVYVLGEGGWAARYDAAGRLIAGWRTPDADAVVMDLAVDADGRVYVPYRRMGLDPTAGGRTNEIVEAGVWVFEPTRRPDESAPARDACLVAVDKTATPGLLRLGGTVDVTLTVAGRCPGVYEPVQIAFLVDTSRSMNWDDALDRAKDLVAATVDALDPATSQAALITFDDGGRVLETLTPDLGLVAARAARLQAWGDSRMSEGLVLAQRELTGTRADPGAHRVVIVISDGEMTDDAAAAAVPLRDLGIEIHALALPHGGLSSYYNSLVAVAGDASHVVVSPSDDETRQLASRLVRRRDEPGLFSSLAVDDVVPANMRFVPGSAVPPAAWDVDTLRWRRDAVPADETVTLRYRLEPQEVGDWPTNVTARAAYVDATGHAGSIAFPQPWVRVWDESLLTQRLYLPYGARRACFRSDRDLDVVLAMDASRSMEEPAGDGRTKLAAARTAAATFTDLLRTPDDRVALVTFASEARRLQGLTGDDRDVARALAEVTTQPGTRIDRGLAAARSELQAAGRAEAHHVVVLLTDGRQAGDETPVTIQAEQLRADGVLVFAVALGEQADVGLLAQVGSTPEDVLSSPSGADLERVYRRILASIACRAP